MPIDLTKNLPESPEVLGLEDEEQGHHEPALDGIAAHIQSLYETSKLNRRYVEARWIESYQNFRGQNNINQKFTERERSEAFIKITKTKVLAAYGQMLDVLFGSSNEIPIAIEPTPNPTNTTDSVYFDLNPEAQPQEDSPKEDNGFLGFAGDGNDPSPDANLTDMISNYFKDKFGKAPKEGNPTSNQEYGINPAKQAANQMQKKIRDQLIESNAGEAFRSSLLESVLLGTGCMKGPLRTTREYPRWDENGNYDPIVVDNLPKSYHVSVWNLFPDPDARNPEQMQWLIERHRKSKKDLLGLRGQPYFRDEKILEAIDRGSRYQDEYYESFIEEGTENRTRDRYEVLEYWGVMDRELVEEIEDFDIPEELEDYHQFHVNVFVCNGITIRMVINPFKPNRIPYHIFYFEEDIYNIFGIGVAENMSDSQMLMNGFVRMAIDNAALAGNLLFEVDEELLVPGQDLSVYPGKVFRSAAGGQGRAVRGFTVPSTAESNMNVYDRFRRLADESTGIPSFSHGQTGVTGVGRTASGISMLLGAASLTIKTAIKNVDDYLLEPLGRAYFAYNMQFGGNEFVGIDLEVKPLGVSSLMQKEIHSQKLLQFLQVTSGDPNLAARRNDAYLIKKFAEDMDLDVEKITVSPEEAALKLQMMQAQQQQGAAPGASVGGEATPTAPSVPGEQGFSGNEQLGPQSAEVSPQ